MQSGNLQEIGAKTGMEFKILTEKHLNPNSIMYEYDVK